MNYHDLKVNEIANQMTNKEKFNPCIEWIKWLADSCEQQKVKIKKMSSKKISDLTDEEFAEIETYLYHRKILYLLKNYGSPKITKEEYVEVYQFIVSHSLIKLMETHLTIEELNWAKEKLQFLKQASTEDLNKKIQEAQDNYQNLSMVDAYILHKLVGNQFKKSLSKVNEDLGSQASQNNLSRHQILSNNN